MDELTVRQRVALMRELGIVVLGDITLGPEPRAASKLPKEKDDPRRARREHYETMLGRPLTDQEVDSLP